MKNDDFAGIAKFKAGDIVIVLSFCKRKQMSSWVSFLDPPLGQDSWRLS